jgi:hypothetical protein
MNALKLSRKSLRSSIDRKSTHAVRAAAWEAARTATGAMPAAEGLESRQLLSGSLFVSPSGSDHNPGTLAAPFQTIQAAANAAHPGDHVEIEAGTYRETVVPPTSGTAGDPIVFEAYNGESVTITGAKVISGWTNIGGDIFQAPMPEDLGEGNNQIFVDGQAINEARFPNTTLDPSHPTFETVQKVSGAGSTVTIYDSNLSQPANYWKGAVIHLAAGQEWAAETGTVVSSAPGQITINYAVNSKWETLEAGNPFYLTGTFKALNSAGEWYRDPTTGMLDIWMPNSDNPANHTVEAKARPYAFDLTGDAYITIHDVNIFASTIRSTTTSSHIVLDGINAKYISQFLTVTMGWSPPANAGIMLNGVDSVLENSTIAYSAGDGVFVDGPGSRVTNNIIHDVDTSGTDSAGVRVWASGVTIDHNTIYNAGRDGILHYASKLQITYNTIYNYALQTTDCGGIYCASSNGGGSVIAYNSVYTAHTGGYGADGIYLDNSSSNFVVHDNKVWDVDIALKLNFTSTNEDVYNNTLYASQDAITGVEGDWTGSTITDNFFAGPIELGANAKVTGNTTTATAGKGAATFVSGANLTTSGSTSGSGGSGATPPGTSGSSTGSGGSGTSSTGTGGTGSTTGTGSGTGTGTGTGTSTSTGSSSGTGTSSTGSGSTTTGTGSKGGTTTGTGTTTSGTGTTASGSGSSTTGTGTTTSGSGTSGSGTTSTGSGSSTTGSKGGSTSGSGTSSSGGTSSTGTGSTTTATGGKGGTSSGTGASSTGTSSAGTGSQGSTSGSTDTGTRTGTTAGASTGTGTTSAGSSGAAGSGTSSSSGSGTPSGASGDGSTSNSGSGETTNSAGSGSGSTPTPAPVVSSKPPVVGSVPGSTTPTPAPTLSQWKVAFRADNAALLLSKRQRAVKLSQLAAVRWADGSAYLAAQLKLDAMRENSVRVGASHGSANAMSIQKAQMQKLWHAVAADQAALNAAKHSDFTGIQAVRLKLAADQKAMKSAA